MNNKTLQTILERIELQEKAIIYDIYLAILILETLFIGLFSIIYDSIGLAGFTFVFFILMFYLIQYFEAREKQLIRNFYKNLK